MGTSSILSLFCLMLRAKDNTTLTPSITRKAYQIIGIASLFVFANKIIPKKKKTLDHKKSDRPMMAPSLTLVLRRLHQGALSSYLISKNINLSMNLMVDDFVLLLPQNLKSIVRIQLDDGRAFGLAEAVVVELHHVIDCVFDFVADVVVNHRRRLPGQVG